MMTTTTTMPRDRVEEDDDASSKKERRKKGIKRNPRSRRIADLDQFNGQKRSLITVKNKTRKQNLITAIIIARRRMKRLADEGDDDASNELDRAIFNNQSSKVLRTKRRSLRNKFFAACGRKPKSLQDFDSYLAGKWQIVVFGVKQNFKVTFKGAKAENKIYLLRNGDKYNVLTSPKGYLGTRSEL